MHTRGSACAGHRPFNPPVGEGVAAKRPLQDSLTSRSGGIREPVKAGFSGPLVRVAGLC